MWKSKALRLAGLVVEYDKFVCAILQTLTKRYDFHLQILRSCLRSICKNNKVLNTVIIPKTRAACKRCHDDAGRVELDASCTEHPR